MDSICRNEYQTAGDQTRIPVTTTHAGRCEYKYPLPTCRARLAGTVGIWIPGERSRARSIKMMSRVGKEQYCTVCSIHTILLDTLVTTVIYCRYQPHEVRRGSVACILFLFGKTSAKPFSLCRNWFITNSDLRNLVGGTAEATAAV